MKNEKKNHGKILDIDEVIGMQRCAECCSFVVLGSHKKGLIEPKIHFMSSYLKCSYFATSTCVKGEQCLYSGLCIGCASEVRYTNGRYSISLDASKRFLRKKYLGGGVLSKI